MNQDQTVNNANGNLFHLAHLLQLMMDSANGITNKPHLLLDLCQLLTHALL